MARHVLWIESCALVATAYLDAERLLPETRWSADGEILYACTPRDDSGRSGSTASGGRRSAELAPACVGCTSHVEQDRTGVVVHRRLDPAVAHGGHCGAGGRLKLHKHAFGNRIVGERPDCFAAEKMKCLIVSRSAVESPGRSPAVAGSWLFGDSRITGPKDRCSPRRRSGNNVPRRESRRATDGKESP